MKFLRHPPAYAQIWWGEIYAELPYKSRLSPQFTGLEWAVDDLGAGGPWTVGKFSVPSAQGITATSYNLLNSY